MGFDAYISLGVLALVFGVLLFTRIAADVVLVGGVTLLVLTGVIAPQQALGGLANPAVATIGVLFVVGAGVRETGGIDIIAQRLLGRPTSVDAAMWRVLAPVTVLSAFMNNTPLVAMMIPPISDLSKKCKISASKLMIPLSYAAILGGTCSLIGTSTNITVNGLLQDHERRAWAAAQPLENGKAAAPPANMPFGMRMFDITWVGLPSALIGCAYIYFVGKRLLPDRQSAMAELEDPRQYTVEMMVDPASPLAGKSIEEAGLRHLQGVYLAEIDRDGMILPAVSPQERLRGGDRLLFVGIVDSVIDLQKIRGLVPATNQVFKLATPRSMRCLIEVVVSESCPIVGKTIRDGRFRTTYNAVVLAVARNGKRLNQKIGDIVLEPADTLLLEAQPTFVDHHRNSRDFLLVSRLDNSTPPRHERAMLSLMILATMIVISSAGLLDILPAAMAAAGLMLITRCCTVTSARRNVDWEVLIAIAASFALGTALETSGAAAGVAKAFIGMAQGNPWFTLAIVYGVTVLATELISNNAAAALMFPLAMATAANLQVNHLPFVVAVMMAASAGFATPIGYQTNLMVYGPGGYRFSDYVKIGVPLDILIGIVTVGITPFVPGWGF
ncbi:MAG: SLC13 family permease [Planctomycetia bacterium]|nr:SLC13 family permease [Planctomycetia bacterium]